MLVNTKLTILLFTGIVSWEWTRTGDSAKLAADITNTRTAHPHLAKLEEGVYTFNLKVTDAKEQTSEDTVTVYVQQPTNQPPKGLQVASFPGVLTTCA